MDPTTWVAVACSTKGCGSDVRGYGGPVTYKSAKAMHQMCRNQSAQQLTCRYQEHQDNLYQVNLTLTEMQE